MSDVSSLLPGAGGPKASAIELHARPSADFDAKLAEAQAVLREAAQHAPVSLACSLGAEDMALAHLINALELPIGIFVLETGRLHAETLALLAQLKATSKATVTVYHPVQEAVVQFVAREGLNPMYKSIELRKACCHIRKIEPLERALAGHQAWITGLRREQSGARAEVPLRDESELTAKGRLKFNPLASWTWGDVWHYIQINAVAYNPLHDQFYPSIGCEPCTRAISLGEDFRAGRWWWESEDAKECGLHVKTHSDAPASLPARSAGSASDASAQAHVAAGDVKGASATGRSQSESAKECGLHVKDTSTNKGVTA